MHGKDISEILQREPIERSMLVQQDLKMYDSTRDAQRFVDMTILQKKSASETPAELIDYVYWQIRTTCAAAAGEDINLYQGFMTGLSQFASDLRTKMENSHGLAEYLREKAAYSLYLPRYYATLPHPAAMEAPFGRAYRIDGKFGTIPITDVAYQLCAWEPVFVTVRERTALNQVVQLSLGDGAKVAVLGAGMLPTYNHFDWWLNGIKQEVVAYDNAPGTYACLQDVLPYDLEGSGIDYRFDDFFEAFNDPDLQGTRDLVTMDGVLSYYFDETEDILHGVAGLLRRGGYFCCEVELSNIYLYRCGILGWQGSRAMHCDDTTDSAIARLKAAARAAGLKMDDVIIDHRNQHPAMVWFRFIK